MKFIEIIRDWKGLISVGGFVIGFMIYLYFNKSLQTYLFNKTVFGGLIFGLIFSCFIFFGITRIVTKSLSHSYLALILSLLAVIISLIGIIIK